MPERLSPTDPRLTETLALIARVFAEHDGRIDPPSSMHRMTLDDLARSALQGELWVIGAPPVACVQLRKQGQTLYLSKLAVDPDSRRQGLAQRLIATAEKRAQALELQTRIELTENHAAFKTLGFREIGRSAHPGFDRHTSIRMHKTL